MANKRKNQAAAKLGALGGKSRWKGTTKRARSRAMRALALKRHANVPGQPRGK